MTQATRFSCAGRPGAKLESFSGDHVHEAPVQARAS